MKLVIEVPDDQVAEFARLVAHYLAESRHVPPPGPNPPPTRGNDPPPDRPADPDRPTDGRTLLGWADRNGMRSAVLRFGRKRGYPSKVLDWHSDAVQDCYHELSAKPPKGSREWDGVARSGRAAPK